MTRLAPILGFKVKIVERTGSSLKSHFPQSIPGLSLVSSDGGGAVLLRKAVIGARTVAPLCLHFSSVCSLPPKLSGNCSLLDV